MIAFTDTAFCTEMQRVAVTGVAVSSDLDDGISRILRARAASLGCGAILRLVEMNGGLGSDNSIASNAAATYKMPGYS